MLESCHLCWQNKGLLYSERRYYSFNLPVATRTCIHCYQWKHFKLRHLQRNLIFKFILFINRLSSISGVCIILLYWQNLPPSFVCVLEMLTSCLVLNHYWSVASIPKRWHPTKDLKQVTGPGGCGGRGGVWCVHPVLLHNFLFGHITHSCSFLRKGDEPSRQRKLEDCEGR